MKKKCLIVVIIVLATLTVPIATASMHEEKNFYSDFFSNFIGAFKSFFTGNVVYSEPIDEIDNKISYASGKIKFAFIGDHGDDTKTASRQVVSLVKSHKPEFIVSAGDYNYPDGQDKTFKANVADQWCDFIKNSPPVWTNKRCPDKPRNNAYFALGNHDRRSVFCNPTTKKCNGPHFNLLDLPHNERYYDFIRGSVHFFVINGEKDVDGWDKNSIQANWIKSKVQQSTKPWQVVLIHESPYSSGKNHGSNPTVQWPYKQWGIDAILSGHDHIYERIEVDGIPYFVNGLGGRSIYQFGTIVKGSKFRYNSDYGAMIVEADDNEMVFKFYDIKNKLIDNYKLTKQKPIPSAISPNPPIITKLIPSTVQVINLPTTVRILGSNLKKDSYVLINDQFQWPTTYINPTELQITLPKVQIPPGKYTIKVINPTPKPATVSVNLPLTIV